MAVYSTTPVAGVDLTATYTLPTSTSNPNLSDQLPVPVGTRVMTIGDGEAVFVLAGGTINQYDWVGIDAAGVATALTATTAATKPDIGVCQVAIASASYGWAATKGGNSTPGAIRGNVLASCAKDVPLYATATAGYLDDAAFSSVATGVIQGVKAVVSIGTLNTNTTVMLQWPMTAAGSAT